LAFLPSSELVDLNTGREFLAFAWRSGGVAHASEKGREADQLQGLVEVKSCKFTEFVWSITQVSRNARGVRLLGV
jgi:hypothetical protein